MGKFFFFCILAHFQKLFHPFPCNFVGVYLKSPSSYLFIIIWVGRIKDLKNFFEKGVDKYPEMCYNIKAVIQHTKYWGVAKR